MRRVYEVFNLAKLYHQAWPELDAEIKLDFMCCALRYAKNANLITRDEMLKALKLSMNVVKVEEAKREQISNNSLAGTLDVDRVSPKIRNYWEDYIERLKDFEKVHAKFKHHLKELKGIDNTADMFKAVNHYIILKPRRKNETVDQYGVRSVHHLIHDLEFGTDNKFLDTLLAQYDITF